MRLPIRLPANSKYRAQRTEGFASKREAARFKELQLLEKAGAIRNLRCQVPYLLIPKDKLGREVRYRCDFEYEEGNGKGVWSLVVEDVKGFKTDSYRLKRRMIYQKYGIEIRET